MSILIKGVEMPTSCYDCEFVQHGIPNDWCYITEEDIPCDCPLVEIPPHGRLIDADKMKESIKNQLEVLMHFGDDDLLAIAEVLKVGFLQEIDNSPTVILAEEGE